jgi:hypothetical protein
MSALETRLCPALKLGRAWLERVGEPGPFQNLPPAQILAAWDFRYVVSPFKGPGRS